MVFATQKAKYKAICDEVEKRHNYGQPILLGTVSVETSELLSRMLNKRGIKHNVLNAKNHAKEALIIEKAGVMGAVTIATNMAGRGTDIKLGEGVAEIGGLMVIGSERHESRRIDNQLRGRSGRQGDPGCSLQCTAERNGRGRLCLWCEHDQKDHRNDIYGRFSDALKKEDKKQKNRKKATSHEEVYGSSIQKKAGRSYRTDRSGTDMELNGARPELSGEVVIGDHYFELHC